MFYLILLSVLIFSIFATNEAMQSLNKTTFNEITGHWFISFYAPWCHHCQKLEPLLEAIAQENLDVNFGKVNAIENKDLASTMSIQRFPTLYYKFDTISGFYEGKRDKAGIQTFVNRLKSPPYKTIKNLEDTNLDNDVNFVLITPCEDGRECNQTEQEIYSNFLNISNELKLLVDFSLLSKPEIAQSSLCKIVTTKDSKIEPVLCFSELSDINQIKKFIESNNYPLVNEFENHNFKALAHLNKTMFLAIIDFNKKTELQILKTELISASQDSLQSTKAGSNYIFGYLDASKWKSFLAIHDAVEPSILIIDHDDERHITIPLVKDFPTEFRTILSKLHANELELIKTQPLTLWNKIAFRLKTNYKLATILVVLPIIFLILTFLFPFPNKPKKD